MPSLHNRSLQAGFGISLLILLASSIASFISIRSLISSSRLVNHTHEVLQHLENTISFAKDAETGQRGYLLTGDSTFLRPYYGAQEKAFAELDSIKKLTVDNKTQQELEHKLRDLLHTRFDIIQKSIDSKLVDVNALARGTEVMDEARSIVDQMKAEEETLLQIRTADQSKFSGFTPALIIIAALLALFITIYFYRKVSDNFQARIKLTDSLQQKDEEITQRIEIIDKIAGQISEGDYKIRLNHAENDGLGSLAVSLNRMADSLDDSFTQLSDRDWLQTGLTTMNDKMAGEKSIAALTHGVMEQLAKYTNAQVGAFYLLENDSTLVLKNGYAFQLTRQNETFAIGEGIVGQCAESKQPILVENLNENDFIISFGTGQARPKNIIAFPILFEAKLKAVIELGTIASFSKLQLTFVKNVAENIGIAVNTAINRTKVQELLEETQAQSEELQAQHGELENLNTELEAQAEKLQASEEELKVQQEELRETNQALEERSRLLEEKNELVEEHNREIRIKSEELALSTRYKSEFLANMSHELRTPLNSILLLSRLLGENNEKNLQAEQVEFAKVIQSSGNSLLLLIDDILDLSKIESGKMELEYEAVAIEEIAREMKMIFEPLAKEKNISFAVKMKDGVPMQLETDKLRVGQIVKNLLSNAIKFTKQGAVELIFSQSALLKDFISITVKDSGIGIPVEKQKLIFEAFQQADGSTRRQYGGTGLGLSISRQLALLLHGDIILESEPGQGSDFTLTIPVSKQAERMPEILPSTAVSNSSIASTPSPIATRRAPMYISNQIPADIADDRETINSDDKVMLIVEDDTAFAQALLEFTRKKGYKGIIAVRGDLGIEIARKYKPAGILLDIQLPVKSGWEVMDELKLDPQTRHIPVHIMSSFEVKKQSLLSGAIDFINKPFSFDQMDTVFQRIEFYLKKEARQVLIIEDNSKHAEALSYFLGTHRINSVISANVESAMSSLQNKEIDCVILDMSVPDIKAYEALETVKLNKGLENIPVIIFTGKNLSRNEEMRIRKYADSIVVKTAHSYRRILDEVSLFLHLVEENTKKEGIVSTTAKPLAEILLSKTALIADDDVRNIFSLTRVLEQHQMKVLPAIDGREALLSLESNPGIDIILMDMMMPEMDGYETISRIRQRPAWKNIPIIAVTAKAMTGDREKCIQAGASDYISKPVDVDQLVSLLRIWLYDKATK